MASLARQRLSSATKFASRRFSSPIRQIHVGARALSNNGASNPSANEKKPNGNKNTNNQSVHEQQRINNDLPSSPLPELAVGNGNGEGHHDWSKSYFGLSTQAFSKEVADILTAPLDPLDIEIKPGTLALAHPRRCGLTIVKHRRPPLFARNQVSSGSQ